MIFILIHAFSITLAVNQALGIVFQEHKSDDINNRPIIGILSQKISPGLLPPTVKGNSYISAAYVKYIESAGGRVVPILTDVSEPELDNIFNSINGVLFPGGDVSLFFSKYYKKAKYLYEKALKANSEGDFFPIWGTCLGFQALATITAGKEIVTPSDAVDVSLPLNFTADAHGSRMLKDASENFIMKLQSEAITYNYHYNCVTPDTFAQVKELRESYKVLSLNKDSHGKTFVSTIEGIQHPFYATQWHPEESIFEWNPKSHVSHTYDAVKAAQYFANFFVDEARKSQHHFKSEDIEEKYLIYKYSPIYTAQAGHFEQCYVF